ncbi:MAG: methyl-accepting chemotaxis protein [Planctomycetota bacterium]
MLLVDREFATVYMNDASADLLASLREHLASEGPVGGSARAGVVPVGAVGARDAEHSLLDLIDRTDSLREILRDQRRLPHTEDFEVGTKRIELRTSATRDARGRFCGYRIEWQDVTAAHTLRGQGDAIHRCMATIEFGLDGCVRTANPLFLQTMGYRDLREIVGEHHRIFCSKACVAASSYETFWRRLRAGESFSGEFERVDKNGQSVWLNAFYFPILDGAGRPFKIVKVASDISATKRDELATQNAARSMATSVADVGGSASMIAERIAANANAAASVTAETECARREMLELVSASREIGEVLDLIHDLADQSNLLAVNAAVEAARAGSAGLGFSVVAGEVKKLSIGTADATQRIRQRVDAIQARSSSAEAAIARVAESMQATSAAALSASAAVEEQSAVLSEMALTAQLLLERGE